LIRTIYSPEEISQFAEEVITIIQASATAAEAADTLAANNAPKISLDVMAAVTGLASIIPSAANKLAISIPLAKLSQAFSVGQMVQGSVDDEYTWEDYAALSNVIGSTLVTFPVTVVPGSLFLILGAMTPTLNSWGYSFGSWLFNFNSSINNFFNQSKNWTPPRRDPLVLDLDNDGIETVGINGSVVFDHDGDGIKTGTGWVVSDDGFLVQDRNDNGTIDTGAELFGVDTVKADGTLAVDGFDALSDLDANVDGLFDQNDDEFAHVQVWRDFNQNGISTADELFSLPQLGVVSIDLNANSQNVNLGNGNVQTAAAAHLTVDGEGQTGNLDLANNPFYREFVDSIPLTEESLSLPDSKASGMVRDLREAVSLSPTLASVLTNYASQASYAVQKAQLDDLLTAWAQTSTMQTSVEQASDNGYFLFYLPPNQSWSDYDQHLSYWNTTDSSVLDALSTEDREAYETLQLQQQELVGVINVLERFNASTFVEVSADRVTLGNGFQNMVSPVPGIAGSDRVFVSLSTQQIEFMQQSYESLKESVYGSLILQTRLTNYLNEITLDVNELSEIYVDFAAMNVLLDSQKIANPAAALADLIELNKYAGEVLQENGWAGLDMLRNWIDEDVAGAQTQTILQDLGVSIIWGDPATGNSDDIIFSELGSATLSGFIGNDILNGGAGNDSLSGSSGNDILNGGSGRDLLMGGDGDDVLRGGSGENDHLRGDSGNDTYLFAAGDGNTSINNSDTSVSHDVLRFMEGISPGDVTAIRNLNSLDLTVQMTGEVVSIYNYFYEDAASTYLIDAIEFVDGTSWDLSTIRQMVIQPTVGNDNLTGFETDDTIDGLSGDDIISGAEGNDHLSGSDGNDTLTGGIGDDTLLGGSGNDSLQGVNGNDILDGGDGTDMLFGGDGDDTLRGGTGANDHLRGDAGNDTYLFSSGDGNTSINNNDTGVSHDVLRFMEGINPGDVVVTRDFYNLFLTLQSTGEKITVSNYFYQDATSAYLLDAIEFNDGTSWDVTTIKQMTQQGTAGNDNITGLTTDDFIDGLDGNDTLNGGDGNDVLLGGAGNDNLQGANGNDILEGGNDNDMLFGGADNDILNGGGGTDTLFGGEGDDTLNGGAGANDTLIGDAGNDTYLFAVGDGNTTISNYDTGVGRQDVLRFEAGIDVSDVLVTRSGNSLKLTIASTNEVITVSNYFLSDGAGAYVLNTIEFNDGTSWDLATIKQMVLLGTVGADNIAGFATDDTMDGLDGNDTLSGAGGADTLSGDGGNDTLNGGADNDTLNGENGNDTLYGNNGDDILEGGDGQDNIYGGAGNDTLSGGTGDYDTLMGDAGNDIYLFSAGDGNTTISNYDTSANHHDVLRFMEGINPNDVTAARLSNNLKLSVQSTGEVITVSNYFVSDGASAFTLHAIEFNDGTSWDVATVKQMVLQGTEGNDTLTGFTTDDTIDGFDGNDTLNGGQGNDILKGSAGNDTLQGVNGNDILEGGDGLDTLFGGAGDDTLQGGIGANDYMKGDAGNDTYLFMTGDSNDTINNYDTDLTSTDIVQFTDVSFENLWLSRSGNNLQLNIVGTDDQLTVTNWYSIDIYQLNQIHAGSSILLNEDVDQLVSAMSPYAVPSGEGNVIAQDVMDVLQPIFADVWL
jgi:Ca2+-binding RTX toxin-like protein